MWVALLALFLFSIGCSEDAADRADPPVGVSQSDASASSPTDPPTSRPTEERPKRIILISLDTVGSRHVSGYADAKTPNLSKIARDGVRLDDFYAASTYTLPAHMSIMTGLDPIEHGVNNLPAMLSPSVPTLASELRAAGYHTKAVTEGGFVGDIYGFDRGFDAYEEKKDKDLIKTTLWSILDWIENRDESPYFLFLHTYAAHSPYRGFDDLRRSRPDLELPDAAGIAALKEKYNTVPYEDLFPAPAGTPDELRHMCTLYNRLSESSSDVLGCGDRHIKDDFLESRHFEAYREGLVQAHRREIERADDMVGRIRDKLIELGQWEDTLFIVTSDHGDAMFEHSTYGHDYNPFNEVLKVPFLLSYPRRVEGGRVIDGLTWHLDVMPTILSFAKASPDPELAGSDLSGVLLDDSSISEDRTIHPVLIRPANRYALPARRMALRSDFKFIDGHANFGDAEGFLFDLKASPDEDENLRSAKPELFAELRAQSEAYEAGLQPGQPLHQKTRKKISPIPFEAEALDVPPDVRRELESLGYLFDE